MHARYYLYCLVHALYYLYCTVHSQYYLYCTVPAQYCLYCSARTVLPVLHSASTVLPVLDITSYVSLWIEDCQAEIEVEELEEFPEAASAQYRELASGIGYILIYHLQTTTE